MGRLLQDIRAGLRSFRRTPGFAVTAILTLALGIGLSTAVFTVADALLLRRLPVREQDRLVVLWGEKDGKGTFAYPLSFDDTRAFAGHARAFERVAFFTYEGAAANAVREGDRITHLRRSLVSGEFFDVLGARAVLGRTLRTDDDVAGAARVAVLSYGAWQRRFGGDSGVLGKPVVLHDQGVTYTIIGVMPQGLEFPKGTDFWTAVTATIPAAGMQYTAFETIGRLAPGATPGMARDDLTAFYARPEGSPRQRMWRGHATAWPRLILGDTRPALLVFAAAAALLLLITCINVANLLLVRGLARVREIAVRTALGAGRVRVVMQLLTENALLAVAGGALGVAVAAAAVRTFVTFAPATLPRLDEVQLNTTVLAGALAITIAAMLLFALAPAVMTSRVELQDVLRSGNRQGAGRRSRFVTEALVAGQVALALLVLSASALIGRSLLKLERVDLAFEPSHVLIGELALQSDQFDTKAQQLALLDRVTSQVLAIPGVQAMSPVVAAPFSGTGGWSGRPASEGQSPEQAAANPMLNMEVVGPQYFATFGIPVIRGRVFTNEDREGAPSVVVVSRSTAALYWPGGDPIGKRVRMGDDAAPMATVVGVVPDTRYRDLRDAVATIYFPLRQSFFPFAPTALAIRTAGPPSAVTPAIRRALAEVSPGVALASATPFDAFLDGPLAQPRLNALLLGVFAVAAVALAAVGLFGVTATMVRQRTRELGVRMALGATAADVRALVLRRGITIAAIGTLAGLGGAVAANRLLAAMLYDVSPTDGATLALSAAMLLAVAVVASFIPARSSTRIDPVIALRSDG